MSSSHGYGDLCCWLDDKTKKEVVTFPTLIKTVVVKMKMMFNTKSMGAEINNNFKCHMIRFEEF